MATIYSTMLGRGAVANGAVVNAFTVPANTVCVVRSITLGLANAGPGDVIVAILGAQWLCSVKLPNQFDSQVFNMRQVLNAGDVCQVTSIAVAHVYYISGYLLSAP